MTTVDQPELMGCDLPAEQRVCPHLRQATEDEPIRRIRTPAGDDAWLVSRHAEVQEMHRDLRFGRSHPSMDPAGRPQYCGDATYDSVVFNDHAQSDVMYGEMRKVLKPQFNAKRMQAFQPRINRAVNEGIDVLLDRDPPANVRSVFTDPLMRRITCELLGVPKEELHYATELLRSTDKSDDVVDSLVNGNSDAGGGGGGGIGELWGYYAKLAGEKRAHPDDSLSSGLIEAGLADDQVAASMMLVQLASLSPVGKKIDYGLLLLAEHPDERAAITADPTLLPGAVEEILRLAGNIGLPRFAREDAEVGGASIREGDLILVDLTRANYDALAFDDPTRMDITRSPNRHMTFSHGAWTCVGAPLARKLLITAFGALLTRIPDIRPVEPITGNSAPLSGGLPSEVLFTW
jgi:cytochrome P450 monooxygenase